MNVVEWLKLATVVQSQFIDGYLNVKWNNQHVLLREKNMVKIVF